MPNRIIKESVCISESVDRLTWFEEVFFYRLIVNCDDFGRFDARPAVLKARLFPLKERITLKEVSSALTKLADTGIVKLYECDGKPYLYLPTWEVHQTIRAKKSKYPTPDCNAQSSEIICKQMQAGDPVFVFENPIRESESNSNSSICAEPETDSTPPVILLPLNDGTDYPVTEEQCQEWAGLYPAVDVIQQLRGMRGWLLSNPEKRKTRRGVSRFITSWLAREQDKGHYQAKQSKRQSWSDLARQMDEEEGV